MVEDVAREGERAARFEISATGPIFGTRVLTPTGAPLARERAALASLGLDLDTLRPPRGMRLRGTRRSLRVRPEDATLERVARTCPVCATLAGELRDRRPRRVARIHPRRRRGVRRARLRMTFAGVPGYPALPVTGTRPEGFDEHCQ